MRPPPRCAAVRAASAPSIDAVRGRIAGEVHLGDRLDDARAADAGDAGRGGRFGEARLVRPEIAADHLEARLERLAVDAHALDGAGRGALAGGDLRALEGRAGRRGAGEQPLAVAEHDLGVGADVDEQRDLVARDAAPSASTTPAASAPTWPAMQRQRVDEGAGRDGEAESRARARRSAPSMASAKGAPPSSVGSRPRNEMVHDRVADDASSRGCRSRATPASGRGLADQRVDRLAHRARHLARRRRGSSSHRRRGSSDPRRSGSAGSSRPAEASDLAAREIAEMGGDGGRADVDGDAEGALDEARARARRCRGPRAARR